MTERNSKDEAFFRSVVAGLVATAVLVFLVLLLLYLWRFAGEGWSPMQAHWGAFGDYLGGTLNPLLGFASVVLLALTLREQRRVLAETKRQAVLEELQRLVAGSSQRLDPILATQIELSETRLDFLSREEGLAQLLHKVRGRPLGPMSIQQIVSEAFRRLCHEHFDSTQLWEVAYSPVLRQAFEQVAFIDQCMREFVERGGDSAIGKLYGARYDELALLLHSLQRMKLPTGTGDFTDDAMLRLGLSEHIYLADGAVARYRLEMQETDDAMKEAIERDAVTGPTAIASAQPLSSR